MENLLEIIDNVFETNKSYNEILIMTKEISNTLDIIKNDCNEITSTLVRIDNNFDNMEKVLNDFNESLIIQQKKLEKINVDLAEMV